MPQSYGSAGFGPISAAVLVLLALFVTVVVWVARRPRLLTTLWERIRRSTPAGWVQRHLGTTAEALARRFSIDEVAGLVLLGGLVMVAVLAAAFAEVLEDVLDGEGVAAIDGPAAHWLAAHRDIWLTMALKAVTALGSPVALAALLVVVCGAVGWRSGKWLPVVLGLIGGGGIGLVITTAKAVVGRQRPPSPFAVISEDGFSFPSGHATGTAAVALLCGWLVCRWLIASWPARVAVWGVAVGLIGAVGFSRIYLGVHYISDVLAGWLLGAAWAGAVILVGSWWHDVRLSAAGTSGESRSAAPAPDWPTAAPE